MASGFSPNPLLGLDMAPTEPTPLYDEMKETCGSEPTCPISKRRQIYDIAHAPIPFLTWETADRPVNLSAAESEEVYNRDILKKRVFKWDKRWTEQRAEDYLGSSRDGDDQFKGRSVDLTPIDTDGTVSIEKEFIVTNPPQPMEIGTHDLHGCTVMTIVSNRAVYMAHYYEVYAFNGDDVLSQNSESYKRFERNVLNAITGTGEQDPETRGHGVTWSLFNQPGDHTRVFFLTPFAEDRQATTTGPESWMYPNKVGAMADLVVQAGHIPGARVRVVPYMPLDYWWDWDDVAKKSVPAGPDRLLATTKTFGAAYFQWDGTTDGSYWRLFYEANKFQKGD
ncbi:hypothetical protein B0T19DRAFT_405560 [Cercophora scortea]|uniref:Uncharacterized protein n=1 Tax=Cercophora scortea TaxID=314031 RepID=A0AAE0M2X6_9PEZI|nr:hypothetical protein B0T19DRAFT_405560 [Cercophora scortea]